MEFMNMRLSTSQLAKHQGAKTKSDSARPNKQNFLRAATFQEQSALLESAHFVILLLRAHLLPSPRSSHAGRV
jgi:hypothetical protein